MAEVLLLVGVEISVAVVVSREEVDAAEFVSVSVCDSVSVLELESVGVELAVVCVVCVVVGVIVTVDVSVVVDVVRVYKGVSEDVLGEGEIVTVIDVADVDEGVGRGCARVVDCFGGSLLQSAFTRFPLCASHISEFGWALTVSHDARMLVSTRCSARWQFDEHCPLVKSPTSHPLMGVL